VSTRRGAPNTKRADSIGTAARPSSHERLSSNVTALVIEQVLAEMGVHARLSDLVRGAHLIESARRKPEQMC
jgi:hypothetical protein